MMVVGILWLLLLLVVVLIAAVVVLVWRFGWRGLLVLLGLGAIGFVFLFFVAIAVLFESHNEAMVSIPKGSEVLVVRNGDVEMTPATVRQVAANSEMTVSKSKASSSQSKKPAKETERADSEPPAAGREPAPVRPKLPAWVEAPAGQTENGYQMVVTAGPYTSDVECQRALPGRVRDAVTEYAQIYLGERSNQLRWPLDGFSAADPDLIAETCRETIDTSLGPMRQLHARLLMGKKLNRWLDEQLQESIVSRRLEGLAGTAGLILLAMTAAWAVLRRRGRSPAVSAGPG